MIRNSHRNRNRTDQVVPKVLEEEITGKQPFDNCAAMIPSSKAMVASMEKQHFQTKGWQASTWVPTSDQPHRWVCVWSSFETSSSSKRYVAGYWEILQTKSACFIGSLSAAIFWTRLVLSPARWSSRWIVAIDNERSRYSLRHRWYSSRNKVGLWCASLIRYWMSSWSAFRGCPLPIACAFATVPVRRYCCSAWLNVFWENCMIWRISQTESWPWALSLRAAIFKSSLIWRLTMVKGEIRVQSRK